MLGKDYMLAIILVNCDDNLWSDQSLETDPDLPAGWRKIHDSLGTYYWHVPTGTTQWQHPACTCFAVRSLGWVEIPEEDLAPGKSSIAVNNCIQQLSNSKSQGQGSAGSRGEGQNLVMILKKDTMSLVDPLDHSLIHCQPILNIRVWGVGCNNGRCQGQGPLHSKQRHSPWAMGCPCTWEPCHGLAPRGLRQPWL
uniref:Amyloid beta precursor protein binding family B member 3 n=1 Tax=Apteryx owenii TaxID=8824 RepID=A0A8B9PVT4_APTOW